MVVDAAVGLGLKMPEFSFARALLLTCGVLMTLALAVYAISPFLAMRLPWRYLGTIMLFPVYLGWKMVVSLRGRPEEWVRTAREPNR